MIEMISDDILVIELIFSLELLNLIGMAIRDMVDGARTYGDTPLKNSWFTWVGVIIWSALMIFIFLVGN